MMQVHIKNNPLVPHKLEMYPFGKYIGSTKCRCCDKSLGKGDLNMKKITDFL